MLELAQGERKSGKLRRLAEGMNAFLELKPNIGGVGINFNALFDALPDRDKR